MSPMTFQEIERAIEESSRSGNYFLFNAVKRLAAELTELRDQHAMARFAQSLEPDL